MTFRRLVLAALFAVTLASCKKDNNPVVSTPTGTPRLIFKFKFDSTQQRLNNVGQPSSIPAGHAAQSPVFNAMSAHYIELAPTMYTALGAGKVLYKAPETNDGGAQAILFDSSKVVHQGETFFSIPLDSIASGTYEWLRVSLAYQNYDIKYKQGNLFATGTVASFIGFRTFINDYLIKTQTKSVNAKKRPGLLGFRNVGLGFQLHHGRPGTSRRDHGS